MKDLLEKIAAEMPDATPEEKTAALANLALDKGFTDTISKVASFLVPAKAQEKTAAATKKVAGRDVDFEKLTFEDVVSHLSKRFGNSVNAAAIAAEEKTASVKKTASARLMDMVKAELSRPT